MKKCGVVFGLFFSLLIPAGSASGSSGTEGAAFLDIPVGAGPAALGSAYSALAADAYAPVYNPAGLGFVSNAQLSAQYLSYLQSMNYEFGSFVVPLGHPQGRDLPTKALGFSIQYLGSGSIAGTDPSGAPIGNFTADYAAYSIAYGQRLTDNLSLGLTGKAIEAKIANVSAAAYAADLGALYKANDNLALSATANNLGTKLTFSSQGDTLPQAFHLGAAYRFTNHLKSTVEGVYSQTGLFSGRTGVEWSPLEMINIRAGYRTDTTQGLNAIAGLSAGLGLKVWGQEFSYAWLPYGDLGDTQYFSMLLKFGAEEEARRNLIQYQTIHNVEKSDPEYEQMMQLLNDEPDRSALAPIAEPKR